MKDVLIHAMVSSEHAQSICKSQTASGDGL